VEGAAGAGEAADGAVGSGAGVGVVAGSVMVSANQNQWFFFTCGIRYCKINSPSPLKRLGALFC